MRLIKGKKRKKENAEILNIVNESDISTDPYVFNFVPNKFENLM